jgi:hypothetical protein
MIKWEALSRPKEFGGLGFQDVRVMNVCLLAKWIDKLERDDNSLCCSLLKNKYLGNKSIFQVKTRKGSQFWRSLLDIREWYQRGRGINIKSGLQTKFWHDCWLGSCTLKVRFSNLFKIASQPDLEVARACVNGQWQLEFRRQLNDILAEEWASLLDFLNDIQLSKGRDEVFWCLEKTTKYTSRSLYRLMTSGGVMDRRMMTVWHCNIPLKVKIFIWMAVHDRIQCGVQLKKKWTGPEECFMCGKLETSDHILFQCPMAVFLWTSLRACLGWDVSPVSCDFFSERSLKDVEEKNRGNPILVCRSAVDDLEDSKRCGV